MPQAAVAQSLDPAEVAAREARLSSERQAYEALKQELWRWSVAATALCFAASVLLFSRVRPSPPCQRWLIWHGTGPFPPGQGPSVAVLCTRAQSAGNFVCSLTGQRLAVR